MEESSGGVLGVQVRAKLMALPAPVNEYSIALPQEMKMQIEQDLRKADAAAFEYVEDAGDAETRQERERERERQRQLEKRSSVLKRGLPRPKAVNLHPPSHTHHIIPSLGHAEELVQGTDPCSSFLSLSPFVFLSTHLDCLPFLPFIFCFLFPTQRRPSDC